MAAYVDKPIWEWRGKRWCHLLADSLEELHSFAAKLGLRRDWFQDKASYPHYDLTEALHAVALRQGAVAADRRQIIVAARRLKAELEELSGFNNGR